MEYPWLSSAPPALQRRFDLDELATEIAGLPVVASVLVQAIDTTAETEQLLAVASTSSMVAGVVGWVDLTADVEDQLGALASRPDGRWLVGIRHLVQDEPDPRWLERPEVLRGLRAVAQAGLVYDLLVRPRELPSAIVALDAVPEGRFVLDHGAKPEIADHSTEPWVSLVTQLAARPNVVCKLSGLVTEAGQGWTEQLIVPYLDHLVASFGPGRLMFGSDWPVCTVYASYGEVVGLATSFLHSRLSVPEADRVMSGNAVDVYRLRLPVVWRHDPLLQ